MNPYTAPIVPHGDLAKIVDDITKVMVSWQNLDDGWSEPSAPHPARESDVWTTAEVAIWLATANARRYHQAIENAFVYLAGTQHTAANVSQTSIAADSGWGTKKVRPSDSNGTALSLLAHTTYLRKTGASAGQRADNLRAACDWLIHTLHGAAGMPLYPGGEESLAFNTCWSLLALADCLAIPELRDAAITGRLANALNYIAQTQQHGGWGTILGQSPDSKGTAYCIYLLQRLKTEGLISQQLVDSLVDKGAWLRGKQDDEGNWQVSAMQSPVEITAMAIVALLYSGENPASLRVQSGLRYLRAQYIPQTGWPSQSGGAPQLWVTCLVCYAFTAYHEVMRQLEAEQSTGDSQTLPALKRKRVFVVHGHNPLRHDVAEFLREHDLEPVVIQERTARGMSYLNERLQREFQAGIDYAIILYMPDERPGMPPNIPFEFGMLYEHFQYQPERICILQNGGDDNLLSDLRGASYIVADTEGGWKYKLERELKEVKLIP